MAWLVMSLTSGALLTCLLQRADGLDVRQESAVLYRHGSREHVDDQLVYQAIRGSLRHWWLVLVRHPGTQGSAFQDRWSAY